MTCRPLLACLPAALAARPACDRRSGQQQRDVSPARDEPRPRPARARALRFDSHLQRAARAHSREMVASNTFSHGAFGSRMLQFAVTGIGRGREPRLGHRFTRHGPRDRRCVACEPGAPRQPAPPVLRARRRRRPAQVRSWATGARTSSPPTSRAERLVGSARGPSGGRAFCACRYSRSRAARSSLSFSRRSSSRSPRLDAREQVAHERRELDRVERLRHVVDAAEVDAARAVAQLGARGQEDDRDALGAARRRAAPPRPASRRGPASSRRAGSRRAPRRAPSRARSARRPPRAPPCPLPRG